MKEELSALPRETIGTITLSLGAKGFISDLSFFLVRCRYQQYYVERDHSNT